MIFYPVNTLIGSGIDDIMVISTPEDIGRYIQLLEENINADFTYRVQKEPGGIAHALRLAENFADDDIAVMLGDNIVFADLNEEFESFSRSEEGAKIFLTEVDEPARYGIADLEDGDVVELKEKPNSPSSQYAVIGLYLYTSDVFDQIDRIEPSDRGELEITDVNKQYLGHEDLSYDIIDSQWFDVGTPDGLFEASKYVKEHGFEPS
jgi:glucose-1-phosphate thymidylyltransferase